MKCKHCGSEVTRKNGFVRSVQRYKCAACGLNFIEGDRRRKPQTAVKEAMEATPEPTIASDVQEMECDEMWHFLKKKVENYGSSKRWIVTHGERLPGLQGVVMLQHSNDSTKKSNI